MSDTLARSNTLLEGRPPLAILRWAVEHFSPRLTLATAFNPEDNVLLDTIARHQLPIDVFTIDTGLLFDETRELWRTLEARYGLQIRAVEPAQSVAAQAGESGDRLWAYAPDQCCALRKVAPLRRGLADFDAWISGIRREQSPTRADARVVGFDLFTGLVKLNPLAAWTPADVAAYVSERAVPVNPLHARGYPSVGCAPCTAPALVGADSRSGRWAGQAKTECGLHWVDPIRTSELTV